MKKILGAAAILGLIAVPSVVIASEGATPAPSTSVGRQESCVLDSTSSCTKAHGLGVKPEAVLIQVVAPGQQPNVVSVDATNYRVKFLWRTGVGFKADTVIKYYVHLDAPGVVPPVPTTPTTVTPPPTVTPPVTPTPTVTPTETESPVKTCTNPGFVTWSDDNNGEYRSVQDGYFLFNDMWNNHDGGNNGPPGKYEMFGCAYDNWYEYVTQADSPTGAVRAYPKVGRDYDTLKPLAEVISSKFAAKSPGCTGCAYNVAYDVWINFDLENELMIWTDWQNQTPAGDKVDRVTIGGHQYDVWKTDSVTTKGGIFTYRSVVNQTHGTMPLQEFFKDLQRRGWINRAAGETYDGVKQLNFGVEVVTTKNQRQRFDFTDFDIVEQ